MCYHFHIQYHCIINKSCTNNLYDNTKVKLAGRNSYVYYNFNTYMYMTICCAEEI